MVLVQILITEATNNRNYVVPISGKCSIRVLNMSFADEGTASRVIQLQSDLLYFPYSPQKYLTMISNAPTTLSFDQAFHEYNLQNVVLQGQLLLNVVSIFGGPLVAGWVCLVTLQVEKINETFIPSDK